MKLSFDTKLFTVLPFPLSPPEQKSKKKSWNLNVFDKDSNFLAKKWLGIWYQRRHLESENNVIDDIIDIWHSFKKWLQINDFFIWAILKPKWQRKHCHQCIGKHKRNQALVRDLLKSYYLSGILASRQCWRWGRGRRRERASSCRWSERASRRSFLLQAGCIFPHGTWWEDYIL